MRICNKFFSTLYVHDGWHPEHFAIDYHNNIITRFFYAYTFLSWQRMQQKKPDFDSTLAHAHKQCVFFIYYFINFMRGLSEVNYISCDCYNIIFKSFLYNHNIFHCRFDRSFDHHLTMHRLSKCNQEKCIFSYSFQVGFLLPFCDLLLYSNETVYDLALSTPQGKREGDQL